MFQYQFRVFDGIEKRYVESTNKNLPSMASMAPLVSSGSKSRTVLPMMSPSSTS
jgi:hypothetical protein